MEGDEERMGTRRGRGRAARSGRKRKEGIGSRALYRRRGVYSRLCASLGACLGGSGMASMSSIPT
jgi:hypothetical protein